MPYDKQTWINGPEGRTPISADRLNHIEDGIASRADAAHTHLTVDIADFAAAVDDRIRETANTQRSSRWYLSNPEHWDFGDIADPLAGDVFLYGASRDLFQYNGSAWIYSGSLGA